MIVFGEDTCFTRRVIFHIFLFNARSPRFFGRSAWNPALCLVVGWILNNLEAQFLGPKRTKFSRILDDFKLWLEYLSACSLYADAFDFGPCDFPAGGILTPWIFPQLDLRYWMTHVRLCPKFLFVSCYLCIYSYLLMTRCLQEGREKPA